MRHLDLFSGIGGFALAAQANGHETVCFVEIDKFCQRVLAKNFPGVPIVEDIREFDGTPYRGTVELITGGFPCQDISRALTTRERRGIDGERSGLWREYRRVVSEIRPRYIIVENTSALLFRGIGRVLGDLSTMGFDAEWGVISAHDVGAPHLRERTWIVAYPNSDSRTGRFVLPQNCRTSDVWDKDAQKWGKDRGLPRVGTSSLLRLVTQQPERYCDPHVLRVSDGIPNQLDRLKCLGNSIVPQVAAEIMRGMK